MEKNIKDVRVFGTMYCPDDFYERLISKADHKIDRILESQQKVGEVPNLDRDDPDFVLPGDEVGDK